MLSLLNILYTVTTVFYNIRKNVTAKLVIVNELLQTRCLFRLINVEHDLISGQNVNSSLVLIFFLYNTMKYLLKQPTLLFISKKLILAASLS